MKGVVTCWSCRHVMVSLAASHIEPLTLPEQRREPTQLYIYQAGNRTRATVVTDEHFAYNFFFPLGTSESKLQTLFLHFHPKFLLLLMMIYEGLHSYLNVDSHLYKLHCLMTSQKLMQLMAFVSFMFWVLEPVTNIICNF